AVTSAYTNPEHAALTSYAPHRRPSSFWIAADVPHCLSGVAVDRTSASMRAGSSPAISSACLPDSTDKLVVLPPIRRSRMPVRAWIHSSLVSIVAARSALVTTLSGKAVPHPEITAPWAPGRIAGIGSSSAASAGAQPGDRLA